MFIAKVPTQDRQAFELLVYPEPVLNYSYIRCINQKR